MKRAASSPNRIAALLDTVLRRLDGEHQLEAYRIWTFWNDEVGPHIARRAQPARFRNGILFVAVATHSWLQELQFMKDDLRDRLNARLASPVVRDICFVSGAIESKPVEIPPASLLAPPEAVSPPALPDVEDPQLAAAFTRLAVLVARRSAQLGTTPAIKPPRKR